MESILLFLWSLYSFLSKTRTDLSDQKTFGFTMNSDRILPWEVGGRPSKSEEKRKKKERKMLSLQGSK
jgi:hypothetical protein